MAIYLTGSALTGAPLSYGYRPVFVHKEDRPRTEVRRLSYEVSYDIQHHHELLHLPRRLRLNPGWAALSSHQAILYDTDHWLIHQAVSPPVTTGRKPCARALLFAERARQQWFDLGDRRVNTAPGPTLLQTVFNAANAIAAISGPALTTRRLLWIWPPCRIRRRRPRLAPWPAGRHRGSQPGCIRMAPCWEAALTAAARLRLPAQPAGAQTYYLAACDAMVESGSLHARSGPLLEVGAGRPNE